ncbi:MAG: transcription/translation regulatory transformer protein RfaH [Kangiellaceae bacterium]|nr:transcription/translation regulatory transformer protein RfaH [Kangiellaceae bacterium]
MNQTSTTHSSHQDKTLRTAHWYLAAAKPKQELRAIENLQNQGIDCQCPQAKVERLVRGKKVLKQEALFPGYLFIHLSQQDPNWAKVRSTRGIRDWVRFAGDVAKLPDDVANSLIQANADSESQPVICRFDKGETVTILSGPFSGLNAIFEKDDGELRSMILVEFLGQSNRLKVNNEQIVKE